MYNEGPTPLTATLVVSMFGVCITALILGFLGIMAIVPLLGYDLERHRHPLPTYLPTYYLPTTYYQLPTTYDSGTSSSGTTTYSQLTNYSILNTQYPIINTQYSTLNTQHSVTSLSSTTTYYTRLTIYYSRLTTHDARRTTHGSTLRYKFERHHTFAARETNIVLKLIFFQARLVKQ
eukprot:1526719-Prymnesium_polylepis.1